MNLENIYNQNYGSVVTTNGDLVAIGNPPSDVFTTCEGFSKVGQVYLIKKDSFKTKSINFCFIDSILFFSFFSLFSVFSDSVVP